MKKPTAALQVFMAAALFFFTMNCLAPSAFPSTISTGAAGVSKKSGWAKGTAAAKSFKQSKLPKEKNPFKIPKEPKKQPKSPKPPKYPKAPKGPKNPKYPKPFKQKKQKLP